MFLGKFAVGDRIPLTVVTVDGDTAATAADSVPRVYFYTPAGTNVAAVNIPKLDYVNHRHTESYRVPSSLSAQKHILVYEWAVSHTYHTADTCEIIAGGSSAGNVHSLRTVNRPGGQWLVMATEDGNVKAGFEPY